MNQSASPFPFSLFKRVSNVTLLLEKPSLNPNRATLLASRPTHAASERVLLQSFARGLWSRRCVTPRASHEREDRVRDRGLELLNVTEGQASPYPAVLRRRTRPLLHFTRTNQRVGRAQSALQCDYCISFSIFHLKCNSKWNRVSSCRVRHIRHQWGPGRQH